MQRHNLPANGGLETLKIALGYRMYAHINTQEIVEETPTSLVFRMNDCRVQSARHATDASLSPVRKSVLWRVCAVRKDHRPHIKTECLSCPPDEKHPNYWCAWKFSI